MPAAQDEVGGGPRSRSRSRAAAAGPSAQGRVLGGRYRLTEQLGRGGMGTVWKADDTDSDRLVVVKEIRLAPDLDDDERELLAQRAMREARAIGRLNRHPNVVELFDVVQDDGVPWLVLELVESRSLAEVVESDGPLPPLRVAEIGVAVLAALRAAHAAGVVHRDVKPGNVLLGDDGRVVLTDFGLATVRGDPSLTLTGMIIGSPAYIAPERGRGGRVRPESDLWSLGATLYLAVEGRTPYDRRRSRAIVHTGTAGDPEPMTKAGPIREVLLGLLTADPDHRLKPDQATRMLNRVIDRAAPKPARGTRSKPARDAPSARAGDAARAREAASGRDAARAQPAQGTHASQQQPRRRQVPQARRNASEGIHRSTTDRRTPQDNNDRLDALRGLTQSSPPGRHREPTPQGPGVLPYAAVGAALVALLVVVLLAIFVA